MQFDNPKRGVARNVLQNKTPLPRERANWLAEHLTDAEVDTLSNPNGHRDPVAVQQIAADVLVRIADSIRPAVTPAA